MKFYITDVFALSKYAGNQLATFIDCDELSDKEMQLMAAEINFSETTFINSDQEVDGGYNVRIFTPKAEIDFAGHPTIGTAYIINKLYKESDATSVKLNLKVGQIPVEILGDIYWMTQKQPEFGTVIDRKLMAEVLSLDSDELMPDFPCMGVSTGLPFTIVPVKSLDSLSRIEDNMHKYSDFCRLTDAKGIIAFTPEGHSSNLDISSRVFVPWLG
ncbi:MAG: PhzF family phenazine biosynthesis protein, partial [Bacteroidales bacterium]|nr:PhzF family phenazine biosynthesis protein [Bacteroidales bacterium]